MGRVEGGLHFVGCVHGVGSRGFGVWLSGIGWSVGDGGGVWCWG